MTGDRLPVRIAARVIEVTGPGRSVERLGTDVDTIRAIAGRPTSRLARRFVFLWFRVFVDERKHGKNERVNVRIPIPIPVIGTFLPLGLSRQKALKALALAEASDDPASAVSEYLDSVMGLEFVRVEERKGDRRSLVVVGLD